jgi:hypothetical protein
MSTVPLFNKVAVWPSLRAAMAPVAANVPAVEPGVLAAWFALGHRRGVGVEHDAHESALVRRDGRRGASGEDRPEGLLPHRDPS